MAAVTFDYAAWIVRFPEFVGVNQALAQAYFDDAGFICWNDASNPMMATDGFLLRALNYLTAHIAWLNAPRDASGAIVSTGGGAPSIVGRISSASEGSVSVSTEWKGSGSPSEDWFLQTKYGTTYWLMTAGFRTMRYAAQPTIVAGPIVPYRIGRRYY